MPRFLVWAIVLTFLPVPTWAQSRPLSEPPLATQLGWSVLPNGMLVVEYDLDGNGKPDFFAVRVVISNYFSTEAIQKIKENHPDSLVFHVAYETDNFFYRATRKPLFYAIDHDEDGIWDLEYKDAMEDGINGNEQFYDSPSGRYKSEEGFGVK